MADFMDWNTPYSGAGRNEREMGIRNLGYTGTFGQGAADNWLTQNYGTTDLSKVNSAPGIKPLTTASFNTAQKSALSGLTQGTGQTDSRVGAAYDKAMQPFQMGKVSEFMNPYINEVINNNANDITRSYDTRRNTLDEEMARSGGFGSTAQGVERARLAESQGRDIGTMSAQLRSSGYESALSNALGLYNNDANRAMSLGNQYLNLDDYNRTRQVADLNNALTAGDRIQGQNQRELDAYYAERDRELGYPYQQIDFLKGVLGAYPTGSTTTTSQPGNMMQGALGGGMLGYGLANAGVFGGSSLPWQAAGNVRPSYLGGGFY